MKSIFATELYGLDISNRISLLEYGLLVTCTQYGQSDEHFVVYKVCNDAFDTGYKREHELDDLINGKSWATEQDINSFLLTVGSTKREWLLLGFLQKLYDCINTWGVENILGSSYSVMTEQEAIDMYL